MRLWKVAESLEEQRYDAITIKVRRRAVYRSDVSSTRKCYVRSGCDLLSPIDEQSLIMRSSKLVS